MKFPVRVKLTETPVWYANTSFQCPKKAMYRICYSIGGWRWQTSEKSELKTAFLCRVLYEIALAINFHVFSNSTLNLELHLIYLVHCWLSDSWKDLVDCQTRNLPRLNIKFKVQYKTTNIKNLRNLRIIKTNSDMLRKTSAVNNGYHHRLLHKHAYRPETILRSRSNCDMELNDLDNM